MQMRVDRLRETLKLLQPVVPKKPSLAVLKSVLLKDGQAVATDLEIMAALGLPEVEGECLIPHRSVLELLRYVPGHEMLTVEVREKVLHLTWEGGKASYDVADPDDYPRMPEVEVSAEGTVDGDSLVALLAPMVDYCATDTSRPVLTGVSVSLGETIETAAGDGFRMVYQTLPAAFPSEAAIIIPAGCVRTLVYLWGRVPPAVPLGSTLVGQVTAKRQLELALGDGRLLARFGRVTLGMKLIEGTAPNFRQLVPQDPPLKVRVFAPELERAVRRLRGLAKDSDGIVRLVWADTTVSVSAMGVAGLRLGQKAVVQG